MPAHPLVAEHWPHLAALVETLEGLTSTSVVNARSPLAAPNGAGPSVPELIEALKIHQDRGGSVPWKKA